MRGYWFVGFGVAALAGCAHPRTAVTTAPAPSACAGYTIERGWLRQGPVYAPCDVDDPVSAIHRVPTGYVPLECANVSATVVLVVDTTGTPEPRTVKALRSNSKDFARAAVNALRQWRYRPAIKDGRKVRQVTEQRLDFACRQVPQGR